MSNAIFRWLDTHLPFSGDMSDGQIYAGFAVLCLFAVACILLMLWDVRRTSFEAYVEEEMRLAERQNARDRGLDAIRQAHMPVRKVYRIDGKDVA